VSSIYISETTLEDAFINLVDRGREGGRERRSSIVNIYLRLVYRNIRANLDPGIALLRADFPLFFIFVQGFGAERNRPTVRCRKRAGD